MSVRMLRNIVALLIVGGHLLSFILLILITVFGGLLITQTMTTSAIIGPLFALYTAVVLRGFALPSTPKAGRRNLGGMFPVIALTFITVFSLSIPILIVSKAMNWISDFDEFKLYVSMIEPACAASVGSIIDILFGSGSGANQAIPEAPARLRTPAVPKERRAEQQ